MAGRIYTPQAGAIAFARNGSFDDNATAPVTNGPWTMSAWVRHLGTFTGTQNPFALGNLGASGAFYAVGTDNNAATVSIYNGSTTAQITTLTNGTWTHIGMTLVGTGATDFRGFVNGRFIAALPWINNGLVNKLSFGDDGFGDRWDGSLKYLTTWLRGFADDEMRLARDRPWDVLNPDSNLSRGLDRFLPCDSNANIGVDFGPFARTMTVTGTRPTKTAGPPLFAPRMRRKQALAPPAVGGFTQVNIWMGHPF